MLAASVMIFWIFMWLFLVIRKWVYSFSGAAGIPSKGLSSQFGLPQHVDSIFVDNLQASSGAQHEAIPGVVCGFGA